MKRSRLRNHVAKERTDLLRDMLVVALGNMCADCFSGDNLEINHLDGCTWNQRTAGRHQRYRRYLLEYRSGVRLNILCSSCNGGYLNYSRRRKRQ